MSNAAAARTAPTTAANQPIPVVLTRQQVELVAGMVELALCRGDAPEQSAILQDILSALEMEYVRRIGADGFNPTR